MFGDINARVRTRTRLPSEEEHIDVLILATKAAGLPAALERIEAPAPGLVLPLLNGLDHLVALRERFDRRTGAREHHPRRVDRPEPGVIVHTSRFLLDRHGIHGPAAWVPPCRQLAQTLSRTPISPSASPGQ